MSKYKETLRKLVEDLKKTETSIETTEIILNDGLLSHRLNEFYVKEIKAFLSGYKIAVKTIAGELNDMTWMQGDDKEEPVKTDNSEE